MPENFGRYNDYIDNIDFKGDQIPDSTNENLIKDKARAYVEKRLQEGISKEDYEELLQNIKTLLERQDIERLNIREELERQVISETREDLDKEALIGEAKTILYEKLGINENQNKNSRTENFLKGIVDVLVIDNYDLAIEIYETNGKIIIDALKTLMSWEGIKQMAGAIGESFMSLFTGNAYEKGKAVGELGLVTTGIGIASVVGKKAVKVGMREISKLRVNKERLVSSPEMKGVIADTNKKIEDIIPKKEVDFDKIVKKNLDIERQIRGLEELGIPESFSRDMLESGLMRKKFFGGDLLRRFEDLHKKGVDYNKMIDEAIKQTPNLTREEALLIFSYTDEVIYRKLNAFMRGNKEVIQSLTPHNIDASKRLSLKLEQALEKMPNLKPGENGFILRGDKWEGWKKEVGKEINLDSFTSVANNKKDAFIGDGFDTNIEIYIIGKEGRIKDVSSLSIAVNFGTSKEELKTLIDFSGKLKKLPKTNNEGVILPNSKVVVLERYQGVETYYIKVKQTK